MLIILTHKTTLQLMMNTSLNRIIIGQNLRMDLTYYKWSSTNCWWNYQSNLHTSIKDWIIDILSENWILNVLKSDFPMPSFKYHHLDCNITKALLYDVITRSWLRLLKIRLHCEVWCTPPNFTGFGVKFFSQSYVRWTV